MTPPTTTESPRESPEPIPPSNDSAKTPRDAYAALRVRDFQFLILSRFLASLGEQMVGVALGWQIYERTHSTLALGYIGLAEVLPVILLALPAGHFSDRYDRRKIALITKMGLAACSLGFAALTILHDPIWTFYLCIVVVGMTRAFHSPSTSTLLPQVVPIDLYESAATWMSNFWQLAAALGPALGGAIIAVSRSAVPVYVLDGLFGMAFLVFISRIRGKAPPRERAAPTLYSLFEGVRFLYNNKILFSVITLDLFAVLLGGAVTLLPVYAKDILKVGPVGLGWMRAAPALGAVFMALSLAHLPPLKNAGRAMLLAVAGFGAATIVFGYSTLFPLSLLMLLLLGAFDNISVVVRSTLMLIRVPDGMRGRISAVNNIFIGASNELGGFESGVAAHFLGPVLAVALGGVGTIVVVAAVAAIWPELRQLKSLKISIEEDLSTK